MKKIAFTALLAACSLGAIAQEPPVTPGYGTVILQITPEANPTPYTAQIVALNGETQCGPAVTQTITPLRPLVFAYGTAGQACSSGVTELQITATNPNTDATTTQIVEPNGAFGTACTIIASPRTSVLNGEVNFNYLVWDNRFSCGDKPVSSAK
ncbi:MAG: hypothetical protein QM752_01995 [Gammaproteobacteria bacterium]